MGYMRLEWVPQSIRRRWREQPPLDSGLDRHRLGIDEIKQALRPHGAVSGVRALDEELSLQQELDAALRRRG